VSTYGQALVSLPYLGPHQLVAPPPKKKTGRPLSAYVVSSGAGWLRLLGMCRSQPSFQPAEGVRPKLFALPGLAGSGLGALVARQQRISWPADRRRCICVMMNKSMQLGIGSV
jgi:hypothetical protein